MSETTAIEWATGTWNPWEGCTKVSPGCTHCYAEARNQRFNKGANWGPGKPRRRTSQANWRKPLTWNRAYQQSLDELLCGTANTDEGVPVPPRPRIFPSLCDWLDEEGPIEWLADFLKLIHETPNLDWLLLTKRPEKFSTRVLMAGMHMMGYRDGQTATAPSVAPIASEEIIESVLGWSKGETHPENVWAGTSVESQERTDSRIPDLLQIPARVRFLSVEPLLGPVELTAYFPHAAEAMGCEACGREWVAVHPGAERVKCPGCGRRVQTTADVTTARPSIHWVIVGGESGPGARACNVEWVRSLVGQCQRATVPVFVKQLGAHVRNVFVDTRAETNQIFLKHNKGGDPAEWPEDLRVREFPKC